MDEKRREQVRAASARFRERHPERVAAISKKWEDANKHKRAAQNAKTRIRRHGLTLEQHAEMLAAQDGVCLCGSDNDGRVLEIDHDHSCCDRKHSCGKCVRALLCHSCNESRKALDNHQIINR